MEQGGDHNHENRLIARDALTKAIENYVSMIHQDAPMLLCTSVVYETTTLDGEEQHYATHHVMLGTDAMSTHVGLLRVAEKRLTDYMNRRED